MLMASAGLLSGACSAAILALVNHALHKSDDQTSVLIIAFVVLVAAKIATNALSQILLVRLAQGAILELSLALCRRVTQVPLRFFEQKGKAQILTVLTDDVSWVVYAIQSVPTLVMNAAVLVGCGLYLAWLSWMTFLGVFALTMIGALGYYLLHRRAFTAIYAARDTRAKLFGHFGALTEGIKELLMGRARREEFVQGEIRATASEFRRVNLSATVSYMQGEVWTQSLFYLLIGLLLFLFADLAKLSPESVTGYVFAMMYMMGPVWGIIGAVPTLTRGQHALKKIEEFGISLDSILDPQAEVSARQLQNGGGLTLDLKDVAFTYESVRGSEPFSLGPLSFQLDAGQVVFVVGGNGSGKSTFVKLLTGLYQSHKGEVRLGGQPITEADWDWYREHFAVVFSDFYLFDTLFGIEAQAIEEQSQVYLRMLHMEEKVHLIGRRFSTIDVSQGQRKRLALITAYLEDRPFYVFDEWAADQDPQYKDIFYKKLLPDLRERGKAVVVITHDDRYYHLGDRVVKLEDGKIVETWSPKLNRVANLGA